MDKRQEYPTCEVINRAKALSSWINIILNLIKELILVEN